VALYCSTVLVFLCYKYVRKIRRTHERTKFSELVVDWDRFLHPQLDSELGAMATASPATPSLAERAEEGDGGTEWYYVDSAGLRRGPHNFRVVRAQLRCGVLGGDDLVWREGLPAWRPCADIPVFASCCGDGTRAARDVAAHDDSPPPARVIVTTDRNEGTDSAVDAMEARRSHEEAPSVSDDACWHASRSDGARFGPLDAETLVEVLADADRKARTRSNDGDAVETLVWHPVAQTEWEPAETCPALVAFFAKNAPRASRAKTNVASSVPPSSPHSDPGFKPPSPGYHSSRPGTGTDTQRRSLGMSGDVPGTVPPSPASTRVAAASELLAILAEKDAELAETRAVLESHKFQMDILESELASTRERAAEATAFARAAAGVKALEADLSSARNELELKTAELIRLRGVLRGKLLARVLAETDETRERVGVLDALDEENRAETEVYY